MASLQRASMSRVDQEFMTKIKKARITQKDVKNEGRPGDVYENKWTEKMKNDRSGDVDENKLVTR